MANKSNLTTPKREKFIGFFERYLVRPKSRFSVYAYGFRQFFALHPREILHQKIMAFVSSSGIKGDYLEFGVFRGRSFITAYHFSRWHPNLKGMMFYAFDSFQGLPAPKGKDKEYHWKKGDYQFGMNEFKTNLRRAKVDMSRVKMIPGFYEKTLTSDLQKKLPLSRAAVVYIDCDLYESTILALNFVTPYLDNGSIIVFDDWYAFQGHPHFGEQLAFKEWLENNPSFHATEFKKEAPYFFSFMIHKY